MTVRKVRDIFSKYGEIDRLFLNPNKEETGYFNSFQNKHSKAKENNGRILKLNRSKQYLEGWVEFKDKRRAKQCALMLNSSPIEIHKRRTPYTGMLWNIKYLKGFKWTHLSEQAAYERASKEQSLRTETHKIKKETQAYIALQERSNIKMMKQSGQNASQFSTNDKYLSLDAAPQKSAMDPKLLKSLFS